MSHLLDTHVLLWWYLDNAKLPERTRRLIADSRTVILVSAVSALEIATKVRLGKLKQADRLIAQFTEALAAERFVERPVTVEHGRRAGLLEGDHRDPFDRLLAAQALCDDLTIVSNDRMLDQFNVRRLW